MQMMNLFFFMGFFFFNIIHVAGALRLTEEATSGNLWPPDTRTMGVISRAAFEVDDYWRIVGILHRR